MLSLSAMSDKKRHRSSDAGGGDDDNNDDDDDANQPIGFARQDRRGYAEEKKMQPRRSFRRGVII